MEQNLEGYYKSEHWQEIRARVKEHYPEGCILTGSLEYDVHHLNYINLGKEIIGLDVLPLNNFWHTEFHQWAKTNRKGFYELQEFAEYKKIKLTPLQENKLNAAKIYNIHLRVKKRKEELENVFGKNKSNEKHIVITKEWYKKDDKRAKYKKKKKKFKSTKKKNSCIYKTEIYKPKQSFLPPLKQGETTDNRINNYLKFIEKIKLTKLDLILLKGAFWQQAGSYLRDKKKILNGVGKKQKYIRSDELINRIENAIDDIRRELDRRGN